MKKIILLAGHAQNGKTTSAKFIKEYFEAKNKPCTIASFASHIKKILKDYYGWNGVKDDWARDKLQWLGTERIRIEMNNPNFHVNKTCEEIKIVEDDFDYIIVDDWRFVGEYEVPEELFGKSRVIKIKIIRDEFKSPLTLEQQNHASETALDNYNDYDYTIVATNESELRKNIYYVCNIIDQL